MPIIVTVFPNTDTQRSLRIFDGATPIDLSDVTRIIVKTSDVEVDSDNDASAITWQDDGTITLKLGAYFTVSDCTPIPASIILFDLAHPNGVVLDKSCDEPSFYIKID